MVDRNLLKDIGITSVEIQPEIIETFEQLTQSQGRWIQFVNMYPFNQNTLTLSLSYMKLTLYIVAFNNSSPIKCPLVKPNVLKL